MDTPFVYGKLASKLDFTDRFVEREQLKTNFAASINTILISPRRWGKSSLVLQAAKEASKKNKELVFCYIDLFDVRSEEEFYLHYAEKILKASSTKVETLLENAKNVLGKFLPRLSFSPDGQTDFSLSLDWKEVIKSPNDILNISEKLAQTSNKKFIICIDEFQNIASFNEPLAFQKKLRSHWQKHQHSSYCLYGSKRHMLMDVFTNPSMPFYNFGNILFLDKIKLDDWIPFIVKRFKETGKSIDKKEASYLTSLVECHPYYVQQLAQQCWLRTASKCSFDIINNANENLILQLDLLFQSKTDELSRTQVNYLHALLNNEDQMSSKSTIEKYNLGTSANITRIKKALINKEIIDTSGKKIDLLDPLYKQWLSKHYFKIQKID